MKKQEIWYSLGICERCNFEVTVGAVMRKKHLNQDFQDSRISRMEETSESGFSGFKDEQDGSK